MPEVGRGGDLPLKPLGTQRSAEFLAQYFDGDSALVPEVAGEENSGHTARAKFPLDLVAVGECRDELGIDVRHKDAKVRDRPDKRNAANAVSFHPIQLIPRRSKP